MSGSYSYYRVTLFQAGVDATVTLTPSIGDPDLYVSWHSSNPRPTITTFDRRSTSSSTVADVVFISWDELTVRSKQCMTVYCSFRGTS